MSKKFDFYLPANGSKCNYWIFFIFIVTKCKLRRNHFHFSHLENLSRYQMYPRKSFEHVKILTSQKKKKEKRNTRKKNYYIYTFFFMFLLGPKYFSCRKCEKWIILLNPTRLCFSRKVPPSYLDDQGPISDTASWGGISLRDLIASRSLIR